MHLCGPEGVRVTATLGELLPMAFGPRTLTGPRSIPGRLMDFDIFLAPAADSWKVVNAPRPWASRGPGSTTRSS